MYLPVSDLRATTLQNKLSVFLHVLTRRLSLMTLMAGVFLVLWTPRALLAQERTENPVKDSHHTLWLNAGFYSVHFDTDKGFRNNNLGLGLEATLNENWSVTAGRFINSNNAYSNYAGAYYLPFHWGRWKAGVVGGTFNGYPNAFDGGWFPAILPVVTVEGERFGLNIALVPPLKDRLYGAVSFQLKLKVN